MDGGIVTEDGFGAVVEQNDAMAVVDGDDGVGGNLNQRLAPYTFKYVRQRTVANS